MTRLTLLACALAFCAGCATVCKIPGVGSLPGVTCSPTPGAGG